MKVYEILFIYLFLYYPFINHVIEFYFFVEWSLKLYWIIKFKYMVFQINLYFYEEKICLYKLLEKKLSLDFNLVVWKKS